MNYCPGQTDSTGRPRHHDHGLWRRQYEAENPGGWAEALLTKPVDFVALRSEIDNRVAGARAETVKGNSLRVPSQRTPLSLCMSRPSELTSSVAKSALRSIELEIPMIREGIIQLQNQKDRAGKRQRAYKQRDRDDHVRPRKQGGAHKDRTQPKHQNLLEKASELNCRPA